MKRFGIVLAVALVGLVAGRLWAAPQESSSAADSKGAASAPSVPRLIKFSGELRDLAGKPLTGVADAHFAIYKDEADAAPLWQETQTLQLDEQGRYTVLLGAMQAEGLPVELFTSVEARWLGVQVGNLPEQPRVLFVSVPYALRAADAETLGGKPASAYALNSSSGAAPLAVALPASGTTATTAGSLTNLTGTQPKAAVTAGATEFVDTTSDQVVRVTQDGEGLGLYALSRSSTAVLAKTLATSGEMFAVRGTILSPDGAGVYGQSTATTGAGYGVRGQSVSDGGAGILGVNTSPTGVAYGVIGITDSAAGAALVARARATTGAALGLQAITYSPSGTAVFAQAGATTGSTTGLLARVGSAAGTALVVDNSGGGKLVSAWSDGVEKLTADGSGNLSTSGGLKAAGNASFGGNVGIGVSTPTEKLQVVGKIRIGGAVGVNGIIFPDGTKQTLITDANATSLGGVPAANYARLDTTNTFSGHQKTHGLTVNGLLSGSQFYGSGSMLTVSGDVMVALLTRLERLENVLRPSYPNGAYLWSRAYGNAEGAAGSGVAVDNNGNIMVTGAMLGPVDFGGGPLTYAGGSDIFVAKFSGVDGSHLWSKGFGGAEADYGYRVAVDASGNVFVAGRFSGPVDFGGGPLTGTWRDIFVVKLSGADGSHLWSKGFGGSHFDFSPGMAVDTSGNVLVTGMFVGTVDFGGGPVTSTSPQGDIFVAKFSGVDGSHLWSKHFAGAIGPTPSPVLSTAWGLAVDATGNALVIGKHDSPVDFGGGPLTTPGGFVVKFSGADGSHLWSTSIGNTRVEGVAVDATGNLLVTGQFVGSVDIGGGPLTPAGECAIFVAKLSGAHGSHIWSKGFGTTGCTSDQQQVAVDATGNVLTTGDFNTGTVDFGGGPMTGAASLNIFVAKFSGVDGSHIWSKGFDGSGGGGGVAVDASGNVLVTGSFGGTVDFGGGPLTSAPSQEEPGYYPSDIFLLKLHP